MTLSSVKYYYNLKYLFFYEHTVMYSCDHYSSLQCHMIHQKSFKYDDLLLKKQLIIISVEVSRAALYLWGN